MNFGLWMLDFGFLLFLVPSFSLLWVLDGRSVNSNFSRPTFLSKFPCQTAARMNFGLWMIDFGIRLFLVPFLFTVFFSRTCNCETWMVDLWILTFLSPHSFQRSILKQLQKWILDDRSWIPNFLGSFFFPSFLFKNMQLWTLHGKVVDSYFSHAQFSFQSCLSKSSRNELWTGRSGGRGRGHHKYILNSAHPLKFLSFHGSRAYSIFSFAQLSWHRTSENERWMVDLGFLFFSSPFRFIVSFQSPAIVNFGW